MDSKIWAQFGRGFRGHWLLSDGNHLARSGRLHNLGLVAREGVQRVARRILSHHARSAPAPAVEHTRQSARPQGNRSEREGSTLRTVAVEH